MTLISGPLSTVTTTPSAVAQVNISINSPRTQGTGVITPEVKTVAVTGGDFSSQIAPGPAVMTLLIGGRESVPIPILVDDVESQTLAQVVEAAGLASGETQDSLTRLVQQVFAARDEAIGEALGTIISARDEALGQVEGKFNEKVAGFFPVDTAREGMGLVWTDTGFRWSWMDRHVDTYAEEY